MLATPKDSIYSAPPDTIRAADRPACVLLVDDDLSMQQMLMNYLERRNIRVLPATRRQDVARQLERSEPNLVILDIDPEQEDGFDLLRELRERSDVPVIITTGHRCDEIDRVVGLELGADDYMIKPFDLREMLARIRALLRRQELGGMAPRRDSEQGRCRFAGWLLDHPTRQLTNPGGMPVPLTRGEYNLLAAFLDAPHRPLSRAHLVRATHIREDVSDRSIDVQILHLRRKLESGPCTPRLICTKRGIGYVFIAAVELV
jgi:two-component system, OmpR family, response regulator